MNSQTSSPHKKSRLWKIVLVTSLALNIAIIGAVGGAFLRFGKDGPREIQSLMLWQDPFIFAR